MLTSVSFVDTDAMPVCKFCDPVEKGVLLGRLAAKFGEFAYIGTPGVVPETPHVLERRAATGRLSAGGG